MPTDARDVRLALVPAPGASPEDGPGEELTGSRRRVVLADGRRSDPQAEPTRRALARFGVGTAVALGVLALVAALLAHRAAEHEGVTDARRTTELVAHTVVEPRLTPALIAGEASELGELDAIVRRHVVGHTGILRVKLWTEDGRIVYSDDRRLVGQRFRLGADELAVLRSGGAESGTSRLEGAENQFERGISPSLLETYLRVRATDGRSLLFEAYYSYDTVAERRSTLLTSFASISLVALVVFAAVQLMLGWSGLRWLREERERLVQRSAEVSRQERLRVASDLHDGTLQDLAGASFVVAGAVAPVRDLGADDVAEGLRSAAEGIRTAVQSLRSMIVDIYPEGLRTAGLRAALSDLVAPLRARGTDVTIDMPDELALGQELEQAVYRAAQEAVRNVARHARARSVRLSLTTPPGEVVLVVRDDGVGFDPARGAKPGHLGLQGLADRTAARGGALEVHTAPGLGCELRLVLPARAPAGTAV